MEIGVLLKLLKLITHRSYTHRLPRRLRSVQARHPGKRKMEASGIVHREPVKGGHSLQIYCQ